MIKKLMFLSLIGLGLFITSCSDDDAPEVENEVEVITDVNLTFTNTSDNSSFTVRAKDPDGEGVNPIEILDTIKLQTEQLYTLSISVQNTLDGVEEITEEIEEEGAEHQIFFSFPNNVFATPTGDGNIDQAGDPLEYKDADENNLPIGLQTEWKVDENTLGQGNFRVVLKHQPDGIKTATSGSNAGDTDIDLTYPIVVTN